MTTLFDEKNPCGDNSFAKRNAPTISELIENLQKLQAKYGNFECVVDADGCSMPVQGIAITTDNGYRQCKISW